MVTSVAPANSTEVESSAPGATPIVIDLGKKKKKYIKDLKRGRGKLMTEVSEAVNEVRLGLGEDPSNQLAPVVLIYQQKRKGKKRRRNMFFPFV